MLVNFQDDLRSRTMLSTKCLNFKFLYLKLCKNDGLLDFILDKIILVQNLVCVLKYIYIYIYNLSMRFSNYYSNRNFLSDITLFNKNL